MNFDPVEFGKQIGGLIKESVAPLLKRIEELEARQPEKGEKGDAGEAPELELVVGKLVTEIDIESTVEASIGKAVAKYFEANPVKHGADGKNGDPGKDAIAPTAEDVATALAGQIDLKSLVMPELPALIAKHFDAHPVKNGEDGKDADPIDIADVAAEILESDAFKMMTGLQLSKAVDIHFVNNPVTPGKDADPITDEQIAKHVSDYIKANPPADGKKGDPGQDGIGMAGAMIDRDGELIITTTKGDAVRLGKVVGSNGINGDPGKDGLSMSEVTRAYDSDSHEVVERWSVDGVAKELRYPAGGIRPGGFYRDGMKAMPLQVVTHDGCAWLALKETSKKPTHENKDDWQLLVRKGRDGDKGAPGKDYKPPEPVRLKQDA